MSEVAQAPQLRFPEFSGEWENRIFGDVFERITTKNKENNKNVLTISAQQGLVNQEDYFSKSVSAKDVTGYYLLHKDDFAYNKSYSKGYPLGAIKRLKKYNKGVVSTLYICFKSIQEDSDFLEQVFNSGGLNHEIHKIAQEGARNHGLLNISVVEFFKDIRLNLPTKPEQQKIAAFLTAVDNKIELLGKKQELLKEYKKGLMQKIFAQEIRFKADDGSEFADWEEKKLGDLTKVIVGGTPSTSNEGYWNNGSIPWLSSGGINDGNVTKASKLITQEGLDNSSAKLMPKGTTLLAMTGATLGRVGYLLIETSGNQSVAGLVPNHNFYSKFLFYTLFKNKQTILSMAGGAAQAGVNKATIESFKFKFPIVEEQTKIANFLSSIDNKIEQVGKQLDKSKQFKKALLQQMFV